jgi:hypothetical protein
MELNVNPEMVEVLPANTISLLPMFDEFSVPLLADAVVTLIVVVEVDVAVDEAGWVVFIGVVTDVVWKKLIQ